MENNNLTSKVHTLKIDQQPFLDICSGAKTCEIRRDDRGFKVGDTVLLLEHVDGSPTEREVARTISHIQRDYGLPAGMCILSYGHIPIMLTGKQFDDFERMLTESPIEKNEKLIALMGRQPQWADNPGQCPNHGNSHCMTCMWPRGKVTISGLRDDTSTSDATPEFEQATGYNGSTLDRVILDELTDEPAVEINDDDVKRMFVDLKRGTTGVDNDFQVLGYLSKDSIDRIKLGYAEFLHSVPTELSDHPIYIKQCGIMKSEAKNEDQ